MSKKKRILIIGAVVIVLAALGFFAHDDRQRSQAAMYATQSKLREIDSMVLKARNIDPVTGNPLWGWNEATARDNIDRAVIQCSFARSDIDNLDRSHSIWIGSDIRAEFRKKLAALEKEIEEHKKLNVR